MTESIALRLKQVGKSFGGLKAVNNCSFQLPQGNITGLIGPNGAGKTTIFNLITGVLKPDQGEIWYRNQNIVGYSPDQIARLGLVRTFQIPRIFARMTVWENLMFAVPHQQGENLLHALWPRSWRHQENQLSEQAKQILKSVHLFHLSDEYAGTLSGGQRKLLELARVLMMTPQLILLDEPMAGVNPALAHTLIEQIETLNQKQGLTFLIIEHDIEMMMRVCHKIIVMHYGSRLAEGDPETVRRNPKVLDAYLGGNI